ncbi:putative ABC transporter substrate-binding protein [Gordonia hirsuta DSM 44140 = NBRC 16056]|uniref:Putative ABC transporter substrate-binding protein n=1 Tax=Gordonia hirsuta DSM 44140 = NBRC 16056 TaxID=1121927 RepID=L7LFA9_9ACTN|nr:putative ABC transporter substrate-binding protein [Gordonia hirsuta DSM 44140 = NBRC 16056]
MRALIAALGATLLVLTGCTAVVDDAGRDRTCVTDYDAATDYFPDKVAVEYAKNFRLDYQRNHIVLTVEQPFPGGSPQSFALVRCGTPAPELTGTLSGAQVIDVPVRTVYSGSTTQLPWFTELGVLDSLTGAASTSMITNAAVRERVAAGKVAEYATGATIDAERVLGAKPDVLLTDGTENNAYATLRRSGIAVVPVADWLESDPLAIAEWIKVLGVLTDTSAKAQEVFDGIASRYTELAAKARGLPPVQILYGADFQGTWSVPGRDSPSGRLITDAGGTWPWHDSPGVSVQQNFEQVLSRAGELPIWLVADNQWKTIADVTGADPRYRSLAAVSTGQVWNANRSMGPDGGNDFYESGSARPDLVLADTVAILHPELLPDHEFVYYRELTR